MEKILIGEKQFIGNQNTDEFINIELKREIDTIKRDNLENIFDFQQHYINERNKSLKFCVYGIVESRYGDCQDIAINAYVKDKDNSTTTREVMFSPLNFSAGTTGYSMTVLTKPLSQNNDLSKNIYGTAKASYCILFELDSSLFLTKKTKSIFLEIYDTVREIYGEFETDILYYNDEGNIIEFGTETSELDQNNNIILINNNFPFFYDRHWVKFNIEPNGPFHASFKLDSSSINETDGSKTIEVELSEPSKFGTEICKVVIDYGINSFGQTLTTATFGSDFNFVEPILTWSIGETTKSFNINIINDLFVENIEQITFRLVPINNIRVRPSDIYKHTLYIRSEDLPISAYFNQPTYTFKEPATNIATSTGYTIGISFTKPLPVPGESIKVRVNPNSTAVYETDFIINGADPLSRELIINVPLSATTAYVPITIFGNTNYDLDRTINLDLIQNSLGIMPIGRNPYNPPGATGYTNCLITLKDGITSLYARYIIPFDDSRKIGVYKTIYYPTSLFADNYTYLEIYSGTTGQLNLSRPRPELTNNFTFDLVIKNKGKRVIVNNKYLNPDDTFQMSFTGSSITESIQFDLPTNQAFTSSSNYYKYAFYEFQFKNISTLIPSSAATYNSYMLTNNCNTIVRTDLLSGGTTSGECCYYLISELKDVYSTYDEINETCSHGTTNLNSVIRTNGAILTPRKVTNLNQTYSSSLLFFSSRIAEELCSTNGSTIPVGLRLVEPFGSEIRSVGIDFGQIYVQAGFSQINLATDRLQPAIVSNQYNSFNTKFYRFQNSNINTQINAKLKIKNLSNISVTVAGKTIAPNATQIFTNTDIDFSDMRLNLPCNTVFDSTIQDFTVAQYSMEFVDFRIYNSGTYAQTVRFSIPTFNLTGDTYAQTPIYYPKFKYKKFTIPGNSMTNINSCSVNIINANDFVIRDLYTNNLLLFNSFISSRVFEGFTQSLIVPTCGIQQSTIPYQII